MICSFQVAEFTLADGQSNTSTSLLRSLCHAEDSVILGTRFQVGSKEHDVVAGLDASSIASLHFFRTLRSVGSRTSCWPTAHPAPARWSTTHAAFSDIQRTVRAETGAGEVPGSLTAIARYVCAGPACPTLLGPLPLGVSVVDQAIRVFGLIFPRVAIKHRLQMLQHFSEHIRQAQGAKAKGASTAEAHSGTALLGDDIGKTGNRAGITVLLFSDQHLHGRTVEPQVAG